MASSIIAVMQPSDSIEGENTATDRAASSRPGVPKGEIFFRPSLNIYARELYARAPQILGANAGR